jgi:hypothetical protein
MAFVGVGGRHGGVGISLGGGSGVELVSVEVRGSGDELLRVNPIRESHSKKST